MAAAIAFIGRRPPDAGDSPGQHAAVRAYPLLQPAVTSITAR